MTTVVAQGYDRNGWNTETITDYDDAVGYVNYQQMCGVATVSIIVDRKYVLEGLDLKNSKEDAKRFLEKMAEIFGVQ